MPLCLNHWPSIRPDCEDDSGSLIAGAIGGLVLGILMIILVSLHLCCGVLKQYGKASGLESYIRIPDHEILEMSKSKHTEGERWSKQFEAKNNTWLNIMLLSAYQLIYISGDIAGT